MSSISHRPRRRRWIGWGVPLDHMRGKMLEQFLEQVREVEAKYLEEESTD